MTISNRTRQLICAGFLAAAAAGGATTFTRPSEAAVDPVTVTAWIKAAQEAVKLGKSIFDLVDGPDLASQLETVRKQIVAEMRAERNRALISNVNSIVGVYRDLANNDVGDPVNDDLWALILERQYDTATAMSDIIWTNDSIDDSYQVAPAYNVLIHLGTQVLRTKQALHPKYPSKWADYYNWLRPAIDTDHQLVRSRRHQCFVDTNPGYRPPPSIFNTQAYTRWLATTAPGKYRDSWLWTKKLANRNYQINKTTFTCNAHGGGGGGVVTSRYCNPVTKKCSYSTSLGVGCTVAQVSDRACADDLTELECADSLAKNYFDADPVVKVARGSMVEIQKLSGGIDVQAPQNDSLVAQGKLVDPWVTEPACSVSGPYAYPQQP